MVTDAQTGQGVESEPQGTEPELHKTLCVTVQVVFPQQSPLLNGWAGHQRYLTTPAAPSWKIGLLPLLLSHSVTSGSLWPHGL